MLIIATFISVCLCVYSIWLRLALTDSEKKHNALKVCFDVHHAATDRLRDSVNALMAEYELTITELRTQLAQYQKEEVH